MIKIKELNNAEFPLKEWDTLHYDAWDLFEISFVATEEEYQFGMSFMETMKLDPNEEVIIELRATPYHFYTFAVNTFRKIKLKNSRKTGQNFSRGIEDCL